jgi:hypothetical protein
MGQRATKGNKRKDDSAIILGGVWVQLQRARSFPRCFFGGDLESNANSSAGVAHLR